MDMVTESFSPIVTTIGGGFLTGILIGWALKKVIKLIHHYSRIIFGRLGLFTISTNSIL
jgi:uncharacterized membrane protein (Fun14 family)